MATIFPFFQFDLQIVGLPCGLANQLLLRPGYGSSNKEIIQFAESLVVGVGYQSSGITEEKV